MFLDHCKSRGILVLKILLSWLRAMFFFYCINMLIYRLALKFVLQMIIKHVIAKLVLKKIHMVTSVTVMKYSEKFVLKSYFFMLASRIPYRGISQKMKTF